jgi:glyceraldehyde 3-phosphate dehydrogenase
MPKTIGINGFGRIGRNFLRIAIENPEIKIVAINDITDPATLAHLLKYDSVLGKFNGDVSSSEEHLIVNGKDIRIFAEKDPEKIPWGKVGVDLVIESTGLFLSEELAGKHLKTGAKKVIISAPAKGNNIPTFVLGVNEKDYISSKYNIISNASCTTNCLAPLVKVIDDKFKIKKGFMTTIHSYTNDQRILDLPHKDLRRARAAALSMIPTTTGAARAVGLVLPHLKGKIDGMSIRVPTPNVSIVDFTAEVDNKTDVETLNNSFKEYEKNQKYKIIQCITEPLVSCDFKGNPHSSIIDTSFTSVIDGNFIKVYSWYDNEYGYSCRLLDLSLYLFSYC